MMQTSTSDLLQRFTAATKERLATGYYHTNGRALQNNGSLAKALTNGCIIAELKPRSPSQGRLLHGDPQDIIDAYVEGGAAAISCLADPDFFDGSIDLVRQAVASGLPVLWKDFVVDVQQIEAAAHHGASAILLIEALFDEPAEREGLVDVAHGHGLEVLLEVHDAAQADCARDSNADVLGVNARDLRTLHEDLDGALSIVRLLADDGRPVVTLSSIHDRQDVQRALAAGARAVLVGTALMQDPDPELRLRSLRRPLAKVCGLTRSDDLAVAAAAGADLVGFVVGATNSPRDLTVDDARILMEQACGLGLRTVLVTDGNDADRILQDALQLRPQMIQVHGDALTTAHRHRLQHEGVLVLDGVSPGASGSAGYGVVIDPSKGRGVSAGPDALADAVQRTGGRLTLIAGGLGQDNVSDAIQQSGAWGADASSSLESSPGIKDPARVRAFVEACHGA